MAPSSTRASPVSPPSTRDRHKLRKPAVEKMRRDRINGCIEQLKVLLEKEFQQQDPNAKLEKADVLEMTVAFLQQRLHPRGPPANHTPAHGHGYSLCWKETLHFLSAGSLEEVMLPPQPGFLHATATPSSSSSSSSPSSSSSSSPRQKQAAVKQPPGPDGAVWRPW